ncbi:hypothetical protein ACIQNT_02660 [Streptomyces luteogriseus]|uniref:hypothetical protein n=1 Tax=Streptomyces luteogriseus TaxID=68233 RepID=UPI003801DD42
MSFFPLGGGISDLGGDRMREVAERHAVSVPQIALAWLLTCSPVTLAIPGTGSLPTWRRTWPSGRSPSPRRTSPTSPDAPAGAPSPPLPVRATVPPRIRPPRPGALPAHHPPAGKGLDAVAGIAGHFRTRPETSHIRCGDGPCPHARRGGRPQDDTGVGWKRRKHTGYYRAGARYFSHFATTEGSCPGCAGGRRPRCCSRRWATSESTTSRR